MPRLRRIVAENLLASKPLCFAPGSPSASGLRPDFGEKNPRTSGLYAGAGSERLIALLTSDPVAVPVEVVRVRAN